MVSSPSSLVCATNQVLFSLDLITLIVKDSEHEKPSSADIKRIVEAVAQRAKGSDEGIHIQNLMSEAYEGAARGLRAVTTNYNRQKLHCPSPDSEESDAIQQQRATHDSERVRSPSNRLFHLGVQPSESSQACGTTKRAGAKAKITGGTLAFCMGLKWRKDEAFEENAATRILDHGDEGLSSFLIGKRALLD
ncbi:hypothetical protein K443DRAFT_12879 [Laccaria amethystina LaAM-08-1]|uniref:Uncharacterized protein n=1 Tax=Laccaria amethystina LaAM-08-1 TaxID=1095629 RepID=A0A0C9XB26_9AGAR|nr:hypothetical protein K443DRAFT_12879 [Laccaria amethystina LaAM-08-1]